ncbi:MAG: polymer-forming cytoskeletal protein [Thiotrichaceae bacterium]
MKKDNSQASNMEVSDLMQDVELLGDLSFSKELHIKGRVNGNVVSSMDTEGKLVLHKSCVVNGEVRAPYVVVAGQVTGNLFAFKRLSLAEGSIIHGDVHYSEIEMQQGATVNGMLIAMGKSSDAA